MSKQIITSKGGSQFHPMIPVFLFLFCVPAFASDNYIVLTILVLLMLVTLWMDKTISINVVSRQYKDGLFSSWKVLSPGGYISIFSETHGIKMQARVQSTQVKHKELRLNYIQGKHKKHIYTAKSREEAERVAIRLGDSWDAGVYNGRSRTWLKKQV